MNNDIQIRRARKEDCPRLMELITELALFERAPDAVTVSLGHFEESGFGEKPVWYALVADNTVDGVVGFALWYVRYSTWKGQRMYLEDLLVNEAWRGKGVGTALMNALIEEAKKRGFSGILWQVLDWNEQAINFYKHYDASFEPEWVNVSINL